MKAKQTLILGTFNFSIKGIAICLLPCFFQKEIKRNVGFEWSFKTNILFVFSPFLYLQLSKRITQKKQR
jgi:hypothetical protein